ncbi:DUF1902 domain-containing protein [Methylotuvimicrobium alcaliphilum]|uniref:DUF1902 domain-containing protein n=1 Tax=Methylotuvimicrobium alcaliphilum (strain DSM 19304 / NCIMB 14124 / VKM B-2133 / 20Z) TaxID=1091494 RepID=G4T4D9_META2|nr:protein of unknown function [Methylotuvimicrobium alcaliphilum 20Z]
MVRQAHHERLNLMAVVATSEDVEGLAIEAATMDALIERLKSLFLNSWSSTIQKG